MIKKYITFVASFLLSGCIGGNTPNSNFYILKTIDEKEENIQRNFRSSVGINDIKIPVYLDCSQIVTINNNLMKLEISEFNRWGENLSSLLKRVIASNISSRFPNAIIKVRNFSVEEFDYDVFVEVNKFDGCFGNKVILDAWWTILDKKGNTILKKRAKIEEPLGNNLECLVNIKSNLIFKLSSQISDAIASH